MIDYEKPLRPSLPRDHEVLIDMAHQCWENMDTRAAHFLATMATYELMVKNESNILSKP